jgi:hypothetical protein
MIILNFFQVILVHLFQTASQIHTPSISSSESASSLSEEHHGPLLWHPSYSNLSHQVLDQNLAQWSPEKQWLSEWHITQIMASAGLLFFSVDSPELRVFIN